MADRKRKEIKQKANEVATSCNAHSTYNVSMERGRFCIGSKTCSGFSARQNPDCVRWQSLGGYRISPRLLTYLSASVLIFDSVRGDGFNVPVVPSCVICRPIPRSHLWHFGRKGNPIWRGQRSIEFVLIVDVGVAVVVVPPKRVIVGSRAR